MEGIYPPRELETNEMYNSNLLTQLIEPSFRVHTQLDVMYATFGVQQSVDTPQFADDIDALRNEYLS